MAGFCFRKFVRSDYWVPKLAALSCVHVRYCARSRSHCAYFRVCSSSSAFSYHCTVIDSLPTMSAIWNRPLLHTFLIFFVGFACVLPLSLITAGHHVFFRRKSGLRPRHLDKRMRRRQLRQLKLQFREKRLQRARDRLQIDQQEKMCRKSRHFSKLRKRRRLRRLQVWRFSSLHSMLVFFLSLSMRLKFDLTGCRPNMLVHCTRRHGLARLRPSRCTASIFFLGI